MKTKKNFFWVGSTRSTHDALGREIGFWVKADTKAEAYKAVLFDLGWNISATDEMIAEVRKSRENGDIPR